MSHNFNVTNKTQSQPYWTHIRFRTHETGRCLSKSAGHYGADTIRYFIIEHSKEVIIGTSSSHHIVSSMGALK